MSLQLTPNAISDILNGRSVSEPVLQILNIKKLNSDSGSPDRYRAQISDGSHHQPCMLATQITPKVQSGEIDKFAIIKINKHICNNIQDRKIIIVISLTMLKPGNQVGTQLGNPKQLEIQRVGQNGGQSGAQQPVGQQTSGFAHSAQGGGPQGNMGVQGGYQQSKVSDQKQGSSFYPPAVPKTPTNSGYPSAVGGSKTTSPSQRNIFPITSINPYQSRWTIRARVTTKPPMKTYHNSRGEGRLFSMDLVDESGEIRVTAFNETADKFFHQFEVDKVYFITQCQVKPANKQYTSIKNDYELYLRSDTEVEECTEDATALPKMKFDFVPIAEIEQHEKDRLIDVLGVVKSCGDISSVTIRSSNRQTSKRDMQIVDRSEKTVNVTLWGAEAEGFDGSKNPVVAIKGARVSDFGGRSLSLLNSSVLQINPELREAHELRGWFEHVGKAKEITSISGQSGGGSGSGASSTLAVSQIKSLDLGRRDKPDYFTINATILYVRKENSLYQACPKEDCNKKVTEGVGGQGYFCEKCNQYYPNFKWRLMLSVNVADFSGSTWLTMFQEQGETILCKKAQEIGELKEQQNEQEYDSIFQMATFHDFTFRARAKLDTWQDEQRIRITCVSASPINYVQETKRLLDDVKKLMTK